MVVPIPEHTKAHMTCTEDEMLMYTSKRNFNVSMNRYMYKFPIKLIIDDKSFSSYIAKFYTLVESQEAMLEPMANMRYCCHLAGMISVIGLLLQIINGELYANYTGDILLGSLFPVHSPTSVTNRRFKQYCGQIQGQDGIMPLEAMLYTLDDINQSGLLPGFELGTIALDSCDSDTHALEQAIEFVKILVTRATEQDVAFICDDNSDPKLKPGVADFNKIVGVVGGSASSVSIAVASLLRLFQVPQVSYLSTSPDLSNKDRYEYFQRTVPSDVDQAMAIMTILKSNNWTYVSLVYEDSNYGERILAELEKIISENGICSATRQRIQYSQNNTAEVYDEVVQTLLTKKHAKVVVVLTYYLTALELFEATARQGAAGTFIFVGSDGWSGRAFPSHLNQTLKAAITVQPWAVELPGFDEYFLSLTPSTNTRNPWFKQFWEKHFSCNFVNASSKTAMNSCTGKEVISSENGYRHPKYLHYVRWSVLAFAHALKNMHNDMCNGTDGLCPEMKPEIMQGATLQKYIENVTFYDNKTGQEFHFVNKVNGPSIYTIFIYSKGDRGYQWEKIGMYQGTIKNEGESLNFTDVFKEQISKTPYPNSRCSEPCQQGQAKNVLRTDKCCWICTNCTDNQYVNAAEDSCLDCEKGFKPSENRSFCVELPTSYVSYSNKSSVVAISVSCFGILLTVVTGGIFIWYRETPVIRASARELSYVLLVGILLSYASSFIFMTLPSDFICGFKKFLVGTCYTICYAAILIKTNRIARVFGNVTSPKKPKYTSPAAQLVMTGLLCLIEILILLLWIGVDTPETDYQYLPHTKVLICKGDQDLSYIIVFIYPFLLLLACAVYAFKTRKAPDGFNETHHIAFTSYTTCIVWLAFVPFYFTSNQQHTRALILSLALAVSATVSLCCLFVPKMYIIFIRPDKNTRKAVMTRSRKDSSVVSATSPAGFQQGFSFRRHRPSSSSGISMTEVNDLSNSQSTWTITTSVSTSPGEVVSQSNSDDSGIFHEKRQVDRNLEQTSLDSKVS